VKLHLNRRITELSAQNRTSELLHHLSTRPGHDEVKADFRELLTTEFGADIFSLEFEKRVPEVRGRIDALIGRTVFEAKSNLDREIGDVTRKMPDYLSDRERETGEKYVGIASDGLRWIVYELSGGELVEIKSWQLNPAEPELFLARLDGAMALKASLPPEALTIRQELGQESVAFRRASEELTSLWLSLKDRPDVALKKQLWASLLKLVYGRDIENESLWIQHTFLVIVAKCVALAVLDVPDDDPSRVLSGKAFQDANIFGAVESDFFDWVLAAPEGVKLVRRIMAHVRRFRLKEVQSDVLKILYESLIDRAERHGLGEYYTPDWLAAKVVRHAVTNPLEQRVLDPACGSGTFLFHAIRHYLDDAEDAEVLQERRADEASMLIVGTDIHPVAVIIARVTYLLALAPALANRKGRLTIPVYLGDAMQLSVNPYFTGKALTIRVPPPPSGQSLSGQPNGNGGEHLDFPESFCREPTLFDKAIEEMRAGSERGATRQQIEETLKRVTHEHFANIMPGPGQQKEQGLSPERLLGIEDLGKTYLTFDKLRREGRDTVWAYVARNLSRPLWLSSSGGFAHVIVGNPPWVAYRHMSADLQKRFKELASAERVYVGGKLATQNDLCALFTVRAASLYLRAGGRLAFVLPLAALTRGQFEKLREGVFDSVRLRFDETWAMDERVFPLFPVPSCVIFTTKRRVGQQQHDKIIRKSYAGTLPYRDAPEDIADKKLTLNDASGDPTEASFTGGSPYREQFRQGATLVPRFLCLVNRKTVGRLGSNSAAPLVESRRSPLEKEPWKSLPGISGSVEAEFIRPVLLGESIVPFRVIQPLEGLVPVTEAGDVLSSTLAANRGYSGLSAWMQDAESIWNQSASESNALTLTGRWNYHGGLASQFPPSGLRVVYSASGMQIACALVRGSQAIVEHKLYWATAHSEEEACFLTTLLNAEMTRSKIEHLQSKGQWGARDFDKVMFNLPIPRFNSDLALHRELAAAGAEAEVLAATVRLPEGVKFQMARRLVRDALKESGLAARMDALVERLLDGK
jgi:SAM-dependent methyltransferase